MDVDEAIKVRRKRRWGAVGVVVLASFLTLGFIVGIADDANQIGVWARVESSSCHEPAGGGGGAAWTSFKDMTCVVRLRYTTPSGDPGSVTFHGVDDYRIHRGVDGVETVKIYFAPSSDTAVNPQNRPPLWAWLMMGAFAWIVAGLCVWQILVGTARAKRVNELARSR